LSGADSTPGFLAMPKVAVYGLRDPARTHLRSPTFSFNIVGADPKLVAEYMWEKHAVVLLADDFYSRALRTYGTPLAVRASLVHCNTLQEVEAFLAGLGQAVKQFAA
jgi:selenocysteine lyase/cysteine desulfurase